MDIYFLIFFFSFSWLIRTVKANLFWIYLWQLKEYHSGRFLSHFATENGKKIFFNYIFFSKVILIVIGIILLFLKNLFPFGIFGFWFFILAVIYIFESLKFLSDLFKKKLILPIFTSKIIFLSLLSIFVQLAFLYFIFSFFGYSIFDIFLVAFYLLSFDIFLPLVISLIVFSVHFFSVAFFRNRIIVKARQKISSQKNLLTIGITGSFGKTSTKEFLTQMISDKKKVLKTANHRNSEVGISLCILNELKKEHEIFVCEMGSYNKGGIKLLASVAMPKIAIITGVNEQHLSTFGSMANLISAEGGEELIDSLPPDGVVIFNGNNAYCRDLYSKTKKTKRMIYVQENDQSLKDADLWATNIEVGRQNISFKVSVRNGQVADFSLNLIGGQNIPNVLLATMCAMELGFDLGEIAKASGMFRALPRQMELKKGKNNVNIIDSTYSSNPDGAMVHLDYLASWSGNKAIIMPCLIELGEESRRIHQKIGEKIGKICNLAIITTKERFEDIKEGAMAVGMREENILFLQDNEKIVSKVNGFTKEDDVILLEGRLSETLKKKLIYE